jgi:hypothetical protein
MLKSLNSDVHAKIFFLHHSWGSGSSLEEIPAPSIFLKLHFRNFVTVRGTKLTTVKAR